MPKFESMEVDGTEIFSFDDEKWIKGYKDIIGFIVVVDDISQQVTMMKKSRGSKQCQEYVPCEYVA